MGVACEKNVTTILFCRSVCDHNISPITRTLNLRKFIQPSAQQRKQQRNNNATTTTQQQQQQPPTSLCALLATVRREKICYAFKSDYIAMDTTVEITAAAETKKRPAESEGGDRLLMMTS